MTISTLSWLYSVTDMVILILQWIIIIRCVLSWIPHSPHNAIIRLIYDISEPILKPFRLIKLGGAAAMIDLSPIFAMLALMLIRQFVIYPIFNGIARLMF